MSGNMSDLVEALARLTETKARILEYGSPEQIGPVVAMEDPDVDFMYKGETQRIAQLIDSVMQSLLGTNCDGNLPRAIGTLDLLVASMEMFFVTFPCEATERLIIGRDLLKRMENSRSNISVNANSTLSSIIKDVYEEYIIENKQWKGKASALARKLYPKVVERAALGGEEKLKEDTVARYLRNLLPRRDTDSDS